MRGEGGNFCSGGDVHEIIGPLDEDVMPELLAFTRMTGDLVRAIRQCPQPVIAAIDGICAGAGAMVALASDFRLGTPECQDSLPVYSRRPCGRRHGRCALLPRMIGQGPGLGAVVHWPPMTADEGWRGVLQRAACLLQTR